MIEDAKKGLFDVIIVHKLDRFARNRFDSAFYKRELKKAGVKLISTTQRLDDSPESIILESMLEGMAEYYSQNLAREAMKGLKENAACKTFINQYIEKVVAGKDYIEVHFCLKFLDMDGGGGPYLIETTDKRTAIH